MSEEGADNWLQAVSEAHRVREACKRLARILYGECRLILDPYGDGMWAIRYSDDNAEWFFAPSGSQSGAWSCALDGLHRRANAERAKLKQRLDVLDKALEAG